MVATLSELSNPQLAQVFNAVTGQTVSRFTDRKSGRARLAKVLNATSTSVQDALEMAGLCEPSGADVPEVATVKPEPALQRDKHGFVRRVRPPKADKPKREGRLEQVLTLLRRAEGATVAEIAEVTGWLPHTTRAYLSKGRGAARVATIIKARRDGTTVYSVR